MLINGNTLKDISKKNFYLGTPDKKIIGCLKNIKEKKGILKFNDLSEISFSIIQNEDNPLFEKIHILSRIFIDDIGWFVLSEPQLSKDEYENVIKVCTGYSSEYELKQRFLESFAINTGTVGSIDGVTFYNESDSTKSLLNLAIAKFPNWTIGHVDSTLISKIRTFDIESEDVYSFLVSDVAKTVQCVFQFNTIENIINVYDLNDKNRELNPPFGEKSDVYLSHSNLIKTLDYNPLSDDNVTTCLKVYGADGLDIRDANCGFNCIYDFSYFYESMGEELTNAWKLYQTKLDGHIDDYASKMLAYNQEVISLNKLKLTNYPEDVTSTTYTDYAMYWLEQKLKCIQSKIDADIENGYNVSGSEFYSIYTADVAEKDKIQGAINTVQAEISQTESQLSYLMGFITPIRNDVAWNNNFTSEQIAKLNTYIIESDYTDETFVVTDLYTESQVLSKRQALRSSAISALEHLSQPQYSISTTILNLFNMDEFTPFYKRFSLGNFITVFIRKDYDILTRLISITIDDFDNPDNISVEYSNSTKSKNTNSDLDDLLDSNSNVGGSGNSISSSSSTTVTDDDNYITNAEFKNALNNLSFTGMGTFSASQLETLQGISEGIFNSLSGDFLTVNSFVAEDGTIKYLNSHLITSDYVSGQWATFDNLVTDVTTTKKLFTDEFVAVNGQIDNLHTTKISADEANLLYANINFSNVQKETVGTLLANVGLITSATIVNGHVTGTLDSVDINANSIKAGTLSVDRLIINGTNESIIFALNNSGDLVSTHCDTLDGGLLTKRTITADKIVASSITTNELNVNNIFGNEAVLNILTSQQAFINAISTNSVVVGAVSSITVQYYLSTSATELVGGTWVNVAPEWTDGKYMWSRTITLHIDGTPSTSTPTCIAGAKGSTGNPGNDGKGISSTTITYQASTNNTTAPTGTWSSSIPTVAKGSYLWTKTVIKYTDNTTSTSYAISYYALDGKNGSNGSDGQDGVDGRGISSTSVTYQAHTSGTSAPTGTWSSSIPTVANGSYLWTKTIYTFTDGTTQTLYSVGYKGTNGTNGVSVSSVTNYYLASASGSSVTTSTSGWTTAIQTISASKPYLWNYEKVLASNNTVISTTTPVIIGHFGSNGTNGTNGTNGVSITGIVEHYKAHSSNSTAPTSWKDIVDTMTTTNKYLWNYETISYSDGTSDDTLKRVIGVYGNTGANGNDGKGISSTTITYQASTNNTTAPTGTWSSSIPTVAKGSYLWTKTVIKYTDNTTSTSYAISYYALDGKNGSNGSDGQDGVDGRGISSTSVTYQAHTSGTSAPTGTWSSSIPTVANGSYLWTKTIYTFTDGTTQTLYSVGYKGTNGTNGVSVSSVTNYYLASASGSSVTTSTSGWTTAIQTISASKPYLWNYEKVLASNNTVISTTTPVIIGHFGSNGTNGTNGTNGVSITGIVEHYKAHSSNSTAPTSWKDIVDTMTTTNKYLWNYETISYSDGTSDDTLKRVIGVYGNTGANGNDGKGISSTTITYQASTNNTTAPTGTWSSSIPTVAKGSYLWTKTVIKYTDNTTSTSYAISYYALDGKNGSNGSDGQDGVDGRGISSTSVTYQAHTSGTSAPTGTWSSSIPTVANGSYLWTKTIYTFTDGTTQTLYSVGYKGTNGTNGVSVSFVTNYYLASASGSSVTTSTSGWTTAIQTISASKPYLWNYEKVLASNNTVISTTTPVIIGHFGSNGTNGTNGTNGVSITGIVEHYKAHSSNSTAPTSWKDIVDTMTTTNKYLWNYETISYSDGTSDDTLKRVIGVYGNTGANGNDGKGISSTTITYQASTNNTTAPTGTWSSSIPTVAKGSYLWTKTVIKYTDNTTSTSYAISYYALDGKNGSNGSDGQDGVDGRGISSTSVTYQAHTSGTSAPTGTWSSSIPTVANGSYLWTKTIYTFTDGTTQTLYSVGYKGTNGTNGVSVSSVTNYYLASASGSSVTTSTSGWTTAIQTISASKPYLWNYEKVLASNNTVISTTTPVIIGHFGSNGTNGTNGTNGVSITGIVEHYKAHSSNSTAPTSWKDIVDTMTTTNKYLWNYETISYSDGTSDDTLKRVIGVYGNTGANGNDGKGISSTTITYQASTSGTTAPTGTWSTSIPSVNASQYLWTRTITTYTDNSSTASYSVGMMGATGTSATNIICGNESQTIVCTSGGLVDGTQTITIPFGGYIGTARTTCTVAYSTLPSGITLGSNTASTTSSNGSLVLNVASGGTLGSASATTGDIMLTFTCNSKTFTKMFSWSKSIKGATGSTGAKGAEGVGVSSLTAEYYLSTSKSTTTGGSWITTSPIWSVGKYVWTRNKIIYTNSSTPVYTTALCDSSWEAVNVVTDNIYSTGTTTINGGKITTGTIVAAALNVNDLSAITANLGTVTAGILKSSNYIANVSGMYLDVTNATWDSKNFKIMADGSVKIVGEANITKGTIGGLTVTDTGLEWEDPYEIGNNSTFSVGQSIQLSTGEGFGAGGVKIYGHSWFELSSEMNLSISSCSDVIFHAPAYRFCTLKSSTVYSSVYVANITATNAAIIKKLLLETDRIGIDSGDGTECRIFTPKLRLVSSDSTTSYSYVPLYCGKINSGSIEIVNDINPCIDFHYNKSAADYTSRLYDHGAFNRFEITKVNGSINLQADNGISCRTADNSDWSTVQAGIFSTPSTNIGNYDTYHSLLRNRLGGTIQLWTDQSVQVRNVSNTAWMPVQASSFQQNSTEDQKTNIIEVTDVLSILNSASIYKYNRIFDLERGISNLEYGFVIGNGYNTPQEVLTDSRDSINLYSMTSILWKGTQEIYKKVNENEKRINELENELAIAQALISALSKGEILC